MTAASSSIAARVFCALDTRRLADAQAMAAQLDGVVGGLKLGLEFFCAEGPEGVAALAQATALPLFLDLKLHDIPNTVAASVRSLAPLQPAFLTLHASGGAAMMRAAAEAASTAASEGGTARPKLLAVTVLTSLDGSDLSAVGQHVPVQQQVLRLARLAAASGMDGIVCAASDVAAVRRELPPGFTLMVPGIRPAGSEAGDQKRVMTPQAALAAGADWLVIGRPLTQAADPRAAALAL